MEKREQSHFVLIKARYHCIKDDGFQPLSTEALGFVRHCEISTALFWLNKPSSVWPPPHQGLAHSTGPSNFSGRGDTGKSKGNHPMSEPNDSRSYSK